METSSCSLPHIFYLVTISSFLLITNCFALIQPLCHNEERSALLLFKQNFSINLFDSTCSNTFPKLASWKIDHGYDNCCSWDGVECDDDTGYVIGLDLSNSCLYGSIDSNSSLFRLVHLQKLNLAYNNFNYSQIPEGIGQLINLRYLNLRASQFSGQIPYAISKLYHLSILDLSRDVDIFPRTPLLELRSPDLKTFLSNLTSLEILNLTMVRTSSKVPDFLTNFSSLKHLVLEKCDLQGKFPKKIFQLASLESINVMCNPYLRGHLPEFNSSSSLKSLLLLHSGFYGKLPISIGNLLSLRALVLSKCDFSGSIPYSLGNLTELEILILDSNKFSGSIPSSLGELTKLKALDLSYNDFSDKTTSLRWLRKQSDLLLLNLQGMNLDKNVMSYIWNLTKLISLNLHNNSITGHIPSSIYNMSSLKVLIMDSNCMIGDLPQWLGNFSTSLEILSLEGNMFKGSIPDTFGEENNLKFIDLSENQLQGRVPRSLSDCRMLEVIVLGNNQLNDVFPVWLGTLPKLKVLILQSNKFYGAIGEPKSNSEFLELHIIDLSYNNFSHSLPFGYIKNWNAMKTFSTHSTYLGTKTTVGSPYLILSTIFYSITIISKGYEKIFQGVQEVFTFIDLSCNRFEGEIPYFIGNLKGLQSLNLSHNMLTGEIPSSLENMTELESFDISHNNLSGNIPELSILTFLAVFNVSYNNLSGPIPQGNQFDTMENTSYIGNPGLCGTILSNKCGNSHVKREPLSKSEQEQDNQRPFFEFGWKIVLIGYGSGFVFGMIVGNYIITWKEEWFLKTFKMTPKKRHKR